MILYLSRSSYGSHRPTVEGFQHGDYLELIFVHVLFTNTESYLALLGEEKSIAAIILISSYLAISFGTWGYFRRVGRREARAAVS